MPSANFLISGHQQFLVLSTLWKHLLSMCQLINISLYFLPWSADTLKETTVATGRIYEHLAKRACISDPSITLTDVTVDTKCYEISFLYAPIIMDTMSTAFSSMISTPSSGVNDITLKQLCLSSTDTLTILM